MCNLYSLTAPPEATRRLFAVASERDRTGNQPPLPAIFPKQEAPVVRLENAERTLSRLAWGFLVPQVSKRTGKPILPKAVTNARDDNLRSPFWRASFESRRCLAPASSFCEPQGRKPAVHHWFALTGDEPRPLFAFAALWRPFRGEIRGEPAAFDTYAILTTTPNDVVRPIHPDRMPVILDPADWETWLNGAPEEAAALLRPFPSERMRVVRAGEGETADEPS